MNKDTTEEIVSMPDSKSHSVTSTITSTARTILPITIKGSLSTNTTYKSTTSHARIVYTGTNKWNEYSDSSFTTTPTHLFSRQSNSSHRFHSSPHKTSFTKSNGSASTKITTNSLPTTVRRLTQPSFRPYVKTAPSKSTNSVHVNSSIPSAPQSTVRKYITTATTLSQSSTIESEMSTTLKSTMHYDSSNEYKANPYTHEGENSSFTDQFNKVTTSLETETGLGTPSYLKLTTNSHSVHTNYSNATENTTVTKSNNNLTSQNESDFSLKPNTHQTFTQDQIIGISNSSKHDNTSSLKSNNHHTTTTSLQPGSSFASKHATWSPWPPDNKTDNKTGSVTWKKHPSTQPVNNDVNMTQTTNAGFLNTSHMFHTFTKYPNIKQMKAQALSFNESKTNTPIHFDNKTTPSYFNTDRMNNFNATKKTPHFHKDDFDKSTASVESITSNSLLQNMSLVNSSLTLSKVDAAFFATQRNKTDPHLYERNENISNLHHNISANHSDYTTTKEGLISTPDNITASTNTHSRSTGSLYNSVMTLTSNNRNTTLTISLTNQSHRIVLQETSSTVNKSPLKMFSNASSINDTYDKNNGVGYQTTSTESPTVTSSAHLDDKYGRFALLIICIQN